MAAQKRRSGFQRLCFEAENEDSGFKPLKIRNAGMPSISGIPNRNVKRTGAAMVPGAGS